MNSLQSLVEPIFGWVGGAVMDGLGDTGSRLAVGTLPCEIVKVLYMQLYSKEFSTLKHFLQKLSKHCEFTPHSKEHTCYQLYSKKMATVKRIKVNKSQL